MATRPLIVVPSSAMYSPSPVQKEAIALASPFSAATLKKVRALKAVYGLDLTARDSHQLHEAGANGR